MSNLSVVCTSLLAMPQVLYPLDKDDLMIDQRYRVLTREGPTSWHDANA